MFDFNYYTPTEVVFGKGVEEKTGELIKKYGGTKALLHYYDDGGPMQPALLERIRKSLEESGVGCVELGGVVPNPHLSLVYEGIELCRKEGVDFLLAIGGGSVIDSAKAIAYGLANEGDVWDFFDMKRMPEACAPVGSVLTIAATGSEMSDSCVITDEKNANKRAIETDYARPKFAVMNPEITMTLPAYQTASGCTDIIMHTFERYFTNGGNMEITDAIGEGLIRVVMKNAQILKNDPKNYEARAEVMWAGSLSHNGLTGCGNDGGDFESHMIEHEIGGMFNVAHGAGLAAIWGSWARYVYKNCLPRFKQYAVNVMDIKPEGTDEEIALKGIEAMEAFFKSIDMPISMKELGVEPTDEQMKEMAHRCYVASEGPAGSAMVLDENDVYEILKSAR